MEWKKAGQGIRYREHSERKNGIKPDRYFSIYFRSGGKQIEQGLGWGTEGMTVEKARSILNELKNNQRQGTGPVSLQEKRELEQVRKANERITAEQHDKESMTFSSLFEIYLEQQKADGKKHGKENKNFINAGFSRLSETCDCLTLRRFILSGSSQT